MSADLQPLQFKMPRRFVRDFKQTALDHDLKLNALLERAFDAFLARYGMRPGRPKTASTARVSHPTKKESTE